MREDAVGLLTARLQAGVYRSPLKLFSRTLLYLNAGERWTGYQDVVIYLWPGKMLSV